MCLYTLCQVTAGQALADLSSASNIYTTCRPTVQAAVPEQCSCHCIGGVFLILVVLDDNPLLEKRCMVGVMLIAVVGVDCMGHVSADQEAVLDGALDSPLLAL